MTKPELKQLLSLELKKANELLNLNDTKVQYDGSDYQHQLPTLCQTLKAIRKDSIELEKREYGYEDEDDE